jgi:hypothetical protein
LTLDVVAAAGVVLIFVDVVAILLVCLLDFKTLFSPLTLSVSG